MSNPEQHELGGEHLADDHLAQIRDGWLDNTIENLTPLISSDTTHLEFEPHNSDKPGMEIVQLPVEHGMDRKKKVIITAAAAATLAGFGIAVLMRGRFAPKGHPKRGS